MQDLKPTLEKQFDTLREPFAAFIGAQATSSALLFFALIASLLMANFGFIGELESIQHYKLGLVFGGETYQWSLLHLVNDGLIAIFFFLIGLEVKRELLVGELSEPKRMGLLLFAALGGTLVPALIYLSINGMAAGGAINGWGIPMATDTALAIGVLAALGSRVPGSIVAFLVGVAIIDDIAAILVISIVYTDQVQIDAIAAAAAILVALLLMNQSGMRHPFLYAAVGIGLWIAIVQSGIHASIAGVIVAATIPARPRIEPGRMRSEVRSAVSDVAEDTHHTEVLGDPSVHEQITDVERIAQRATTPLRRWEDTLELPVALLILPLFAFLNAGVIINSETLHNLTVDPVALGIIAGLVAGKPLGILLGVKIGEWTGLAERPSNLDARRLIGIGMLAGIGFTMSTFIAHLAFETNADQLAVAKLAIVVASTIAAFGGFAALFRVGEQSGQPDQ